MSYVVRGRCQSGKRWFWYAALWTRDYGKHCDDPVCEPGYGGHAYGWENTVDQAERMMLASAADLAASLGDDGANVMNGQPARGAQYAATALKRINSAKRKARPPSSTTGARAVEYLYGTHFWYSYDGEQRELIPFRITRKTAKRIYYIRSHRYADLGEDPQIGYISRQDLETDTRCPGSQDCDHRCEHGWSASHGEPPGEISTGRHYYDSDSHLFSTREAAEDYLYSAERERERAQREAGPGIRQLRREMADAHPDRGGTAEDFMAARERYQRALAKSLATAGKA